MLFVILGICAVFAIVMAAVIWVEQRDKEQRKAKGLPAKKYHDINDYDVTTVYSIRRK